MFKFRLLLLFVGVCGVILGTDSYTYPAAPGYAQPDYGYMSYAPPVYPSYSPPNYGSYGKGYGSSYSANCAYMKVIEVLDQIFCQHADKQRYSSTIYPAIDTIIDQLEWIYEFVFMESVYDYTYSAIHELKTLQDSVYNTYGDSSLLDSYYEGYEDTTSTSGTGTASTGTTNTRTTAANKLSNHINTRDQKKADVTQFKTSQAVNFQPNKQSQTLGTKGEKKAVKKVKTTKIEVDVEDTDVSQRSGSEASLLNINALNVGERKEQKTEQEHDSTLITANLLNVLEDVKKKKRSSKDNLSKARSSRSAQVKSRKARDAEYSDYTCSYLSAVYCSEDKYDELLYNILERLFTAIDYLELAMGDLDWFLSNFDCSENELAYGEAAFTYGAIYMAYYTLIDVTIEVERMYEIMELDYGNESSSYYRAGGSSYSSTQQSTTSYPIKSTPSYINKTPYMPSYPYSGYISQPPSAVSYSVPQQYRIQRAAETSAIPQVFLVG